MLTRDAEDYLRNYYAGSIREWARDEGYEYHGVGVYTWYGEPVDIESEFEDYVEMQGGVS